MDAQQPIFDFEYTRLKKTFPKCWLYRLSVVNDFEHVICDNAKYITHCGYSIENNIASDIRLSRNVVNKESKRSRRFVSQYPQ